MASDQLTQEEAVKAQAASETIAMITNVSPVFMSLIRGIVATGLGKKLL